MIRPATFPGETPDETCREMSGEVFGEVSHEVQRAWEALVRRVGERGQGLGTPHYAAESQLNFSEPSGVGACLFRGTLPASI